MWARLVLGVVAVAAFIAAADAHAWMSDPAGRSGGTISKASTSATCNPGASALTIGNTGTAVTVSGQRANGHGDTLTATVYTCDASTDAAAAACRNAAIGTGVWTQRTSRNLDTNNAGSQTIGNVNGLTGNFIIGAKLAFSTTDVWYDCALVTVTSTIGGGGATCSSSNGGCDTNARCDSSTGSIVCTCKFPSFYGNGRVCTPVLDNQYVRLSLKLAGNQCDSKLQEQVTSSVAAVAGVSTDIINYDICAYDVANGFSMAYLTVSPDRITGAKNYDVQFQVQRAVANGNSFLSGRTVLAASAGSDVTVVAGGGSDSKGWIAAAVLVPLFVLAAIGGGYWYYKKREREGRPITNPCAGALTKSTTGKKDQTYVGVAATGGAAAATTTTRFGNTTAASTGASSAAPLPASRPQPSAWTAEKDGAGHIYYFNHQTGESTWEKPKGVFIPPPK